MLQALAGVLDAPALVVWLGEGDGGHLFGRDITRTLLCGVMDLTCTGADSPSAAAKNSSMETCSMWSTDEGS